MREKSLKELLEDDNNLDQAKLVIAAQDVLDRLQKIAEHLAELGAEEIMPLSDNMKAAFGPDVAREFEQAADQAIQKALESVRGARDTIDVAILKVQGNMPNSDMDNYDSNADNNPTLDNDMSAQDNQEIATDANQQMQAGEDDTILGGDNFDGSEAAAGDDPMGRAKKESVENRKSLVESIFYNAGKIAIMTETVGDLVNWISDSKKQKMNDEDYKIFKEHLDKKLKVDPISVAGWIALQKPKKVNESKLTPDQKKSYAIAKVIEANITAYGHGKAASVVRQFSSTDLRENAEKTLIETFKDIYGMSPAEYSVTMKHKMSEDITPSADPSPVDNGMKPEEDMTNMQKSDAAKGIAKMASEIGDNVANGNKPVSAAMSDLSPQEKNAVGDVVDNIQDTTGQTPDKVSDLLKKASDVIGENFSRVNNCPKNLLENIIKYNKKLGNTAFVDNVYKALEK